MPLNSRAVPANLRTNDFNCVLIEVLFNVLESLFVRAKLTLT